MMWLGAKDSKHSLILTDASSVFAGIPTDQTPSFFNLPLDALEDDDDINRFTDSDYAEEVELATRHRALENASSRDELGHDGGTRIRRTAAPSNGGAQDRRAEPLLRDHKYVTKR